MLLYPFLLNPFSFTHHLSQLTSMALSSCLSRSHLQFKVNSPALNDRSSRGTWIAPRSQKLKTGLSFTGPSVPLTRESFGLATVTSKDETFSASCLPSSQLAASAFTVGTIAVLPFYTLMVAAPKAQLTKRLVGSSIPYIVLGLVYGYLLCCSWTPDTIRLMFSSKYWLPELSAIAKLFSSEMTLASAWVHLLAIDLFAARQVFQEGLREDIETRHSVSLCLLFCPLGVATHFITKAMTKKGEQANPLA